MYTKRSLTVLACALLMAGSIQAASPLVGKWQNAGAASKAVLTFSADGNYQVDTNGDGTAELSGKYMVKPERRVVVSEKGQASGLYEYEVDGPALRFYLDTDPNDARKDVLVKKSWVRKSY